MFMGTGFILMCAGAVILVADLVLIVVSAATVRKRREKALEYLKKHY